MYEKGAFSRSLSTLPCCPSAAAGVLPGPTPRISTRTPSLLLRVRSRGLLNYVRSHFEVKETGKAKYPGDDDRRPAPPFIFRARAIGSEGPYNIRLLIQPGPAGRILDRRAGEQRRGSRAAPQRTTARKSRSSLPQQEPPPEPFQPQEAQPAYQSPALNQGEVKPLPAQNASQPAQQPAPSEPTSDTPSGPTADTPSGPIAPSSSSTGSANPQQNLAPPPDPAPSQ